jgi:hypothetical protein
MAEWLGKGLQNPVPRFDSGCRLSEWRCMYGRLAQGESASLTRKRSVVRIHYRPLANSAILQQKLANAPTLASIGTRRMTQLQYLLQLSSPTSENSVMAKFAEFLFHVSRERPLRPTPIVQDRRRGMLIPPGIMCWCTRTQEPTQTKAVGRRLRASGWGKAKGRSPVP